MHELVLKLFGILKNFWQFMKIICSASIALLLLYWIQNLLGVQWQWLGFITPFFDSLLELADTICSAKMDLFGAVCELKYLVAIIILVGLFYLMNLFIMLTENIEEGYLSTRKFCRKAEENRINKSLKNDVIKQEKNIQKYVVVIHTELKKNVASMNSNLNIDEQNKIMNDFLYEKLHKKYAMYDGGFMYSFDDYDNIDNVLDVLFKILDSSAPMNYTICIQSENDMQQLKKLIDLKHFGKITMAADTSYRYKFNKVQKYLTSQIGIFQYENGTMEVHEILRK